MLTTSFNNNFSVDFNLTFNTSILIDAAISLQLNSINANEFFNNLNPNLYSISNINSLNFIT
jgi:hypothetical protein